MQMALSIPEDLMSHQLAKSVERPLTASAGIQFKGSGHVKYLRALIKHIPKRSNR